MQLIDGFCGAPESCCKHHWVVGLVKSPYGDRIGLWRWWHTNTKRLADIEYHVNTVPIPWQYLTKQI